MRRQMDAGRVDPEVGPGQEKVGLDRAHRPIDREKTKRALGRGATRSERYS